MKMQLHQQKSYQILLKLLTNSKLRLALSKAKYLLKKKLLLSHHFQAAKDCFLCSFQYFKHQFAMSHTLSKQLPTKQKKQLKVYLAISIPKRSEEHTSELQ